MTVYTKELLGSSGNGQPIAVVATAIASGTLIHTAVAGTTGIDEVYLYVSNVDSAAHQLTLSWGSSSGNGLIMKSVSIPPNSGPTPIVTGIPLQNGLTITASADTANVLNISGFVNRIQ